MMENKSCLLTVLFCIVTITTLTQSAVIITKRSNDGDYLRIKRTVVPIDNNYTMEFEYLIHPETEKPAANYGSGRPGKTTRKHRCGLITSVPTSVRSALRLDNFYQKYTHAYGIPVIGSNTLSDDALKRACYVVRFLFADNKNTRQSYYRMYGRFALMASTEVTTDIPEHKSLGAWWNQRARGLGATTDRPVSTAGEENALCWNSDRYREEDIVLHEYAHGMDLLGATYAIRGFANRLANLYNKAKSRGMWANTYSMSTKQEYFAVGVQAYFDSGKYRAVANGVHGPYGASRSALKGYDRELYTLVEEQFPCGNKYIKRCNKDRNAEMSQKLKLDCQDGGGTYEGDDDEDDGGDDEDDSIEEGECVDNHQHCTYWLGEGYCVNEEYTDYMKEHCKLTCKHCDESPPTVAPTTTKKDSGSDEDDDDDDDDDDEDKTECVDTHENCAFWLGEGQCENEEFTEYMKVHCRFTCKHCDDTTPTVTPSTTKKDDGSDEDETDCADNIDCCKEFVDSGFCSSYEDFMSNECKKSCGICGVVTTEKTTMKTTTAATACDDQNESCAAWAQNGECEKNPEYMLDSCKKSCRKCEGEEETTTNCKDNNIDCESWAARGECQANPDWMMDNCKKSCQVC